MEKTIFVVGAGKGLGNAAARKFAENGFRVVLMCRSAQHLESYQREMQAEGIKAEIQEVDASDQQALAETLKKAMHTYGKPDVLFYNVGITVCDSEIKSGIDAEIMDERYKTDVLGAYTCIKEMADDTSDGKETAVLITGGGLAMYPSADYLPLSMDKAALRAMVKALNPVYEKQGMFIGTVQVCGTIGGSEKYMPENIADQFWKLYEDRREDEIIY